MRASPIPIFQTLLSLALLAPVLGAPLVDVVFYQEALCPFCAAYTATTLHGVMAMGLSRIMRLQVVPWGNARRDWASGEVTCQHGAKECEYNELLNCAIDQNPEQDAFFPFIACVEEKARGGDTVAALGEQCARHAGLDWTRMWECKTSGQGHQLHLKAGELTDALRPPHQYVPWVVVNGVPLMDDDEKLAKFVCTAYTGDDRPAACLTLGLGGGLDTEAVAADADAAASGSLAKGRSASSSAAATTTTASGGVEGLDSELPGVSGMLSRLWLGRGRWAKA